MMILPTGFTTGKTHLLAGFVPISENQMEGAYSQMLAKKLLPDTVSQKLSKNTKEDTFQRDA
jgi:hypothetical protein